MLRTARSTIVLAIVAASAAAILAAAPAAADTGNATVIASGLDNPRGLTFGPDGKLYVALGGTGGQLQTTPNDCEQAPVPVGPYSGGFTASIVTVAPNGTVTPVATGLPSSTTSPLLGSLTSGVADVTFIGHTLYALEAGAGCSHGLLGTDNSILRVNSNGTTTPVANLSAFIKAHPVANPEPDDFEPDGTWYSMVPFKGDLYAVEPNHGEVDRIDPGTGTISRVVDVSASQGHIVPTSIAFGGLFGGFALGNLGTFPITPGSEQLMRVSPFGGGLSVVRTGFTTMLGLDFDLWGNLYILESMTAPGFPGPDQFGTGKIVRINIFGGTSTIATGLTFPTGMTIGPDGALYVSNLGFAGPGAGQILRIPTSREF
jgi:hypothetical protein